MIDPKINPTIFGIPYVKSLYLNDKVAKSILSYVYSPETYQLDCDKIYNNLYTRNILSRHLFFESFLEKHTNNHSQLLILSCGLDTKPDVLKVLENKKCYGLDLLGDQINTVKNKTKTLNNITILTCDFKFLNTSSILHRLKESGLDSQMKTCMIWEGARFI